MKKQTNDVTKQTSDLSKQTSDLSTGMQSMANYFQGRLDTHEVRHDQSDARHNQSDARHNQSDARHAEQRGLIDGLGVDLGIVQDQIHQLQINQQQLLERQEGSENRQPHGFVTPTATPRTARAHGFFARTASTRTMSSNKASTPLVETVNEGD